MPVRGLGTHSVCPNADRQSACAGGASPDNLRRYEIAEVRRKARNLPRGHLQADLDIVHPPGLPPVDKMLAEAELIKVNFVAHPCYAMLCWAVMHLVIWAGLCCVVLCRAVLLCVANAFFLYYVCQCLLKSCGDSRRESSRESSRDSRLEINHKAITVFKAAMSIIYAS